jgi:hypothetical protein
MTKPKQAPSFYKTAWLVVSHASILIYTSVHTIVAPIGFAWASGLAKTEGDATSACYYLLCAGLLIITTKEVDKIYAESYARLTKVINESDSND